jgi:hypothetical protein
MGCELTKLTKNRSSSTKANNSTGNGGNFDSIAPGPPPTTDPRLPLTAKQKYSIVASWKGISRAMEQTGITMFIK